MKKPRTVRAPAILKAKPPAIPKGRQSAPEKVAEKVVKQAQQKGV